MYDSAPLPHEYLRWIICRGDDRLGRENDPSSGQLTGVLPGDN